MASKEVVFTTCDKCFKEAQQDVEKPTRQEKYILPPGWLHITGNTRTTTVFEMDLCEDCKQYVIEAAGRAG